MTAGSEKRKNFLVAARQAAIKYWHRSWWHRLAILLIIFVLLLTGGMYGVAQWFVWSNRNEPYNFGASFIADYSKYLGLDPHANYLAILNDLGVKRLRLVSYWSDIEAAKGQYDFSELDWEFQQAAAHGAKISLAIGLRQPRWPECHPPDWVNSEPMSVWQPQLLEFMTAVINRYKTSPALDSYQLENEYYLMQFGNCTDDSTSRLITETNLVRRLDPRHTLIITRSNNIVGWGINPPIPDEYGMSIYLRVWSTPIGRYLEYPFPDWYYSFMAGMEKIWTGKNTFIHELETEPWVPDGQSVLTTSLAEQNKTMNLDDFNYTIAFAKRTGMKPIYLWGTEYWYYRMTVLHQPDLWNAARSTFQNQR